MIMNNELKLSHHLRRGTEENHIYFQSRYTVSDRDSNSGPLENESGALKTSP